MNTLEILMTLIKKYEGCKLKAYKDFTGVWTIGYGVTGPAIKQGVIWSQHQADEALVYRAKEALESAFRLSPVLKSESDSKQVAIADFIYNLGAGNYAKSSLKLRVDQKNWVSAVHEIKKWNKANGVALAGLTRRREEEAKLLASCY